MATLFAKPTPHGLTATRSAPVALGQPLRLAFTWLACRLRSALIALGENSQPEPRTFGLPLGRYDSPEQRAALRAFNSLRD